MNVLINTEIPSLKRDPYSKALLLSDGKSNDEYKLKKHLIKSGKDNTNEIKIIKNEINNLKDSLEEIKNLLKRIA